MKCCEHNPCPERPRWFLGRFTTRPWRCPQCGYLWITEGNYLWGDFNGYQWVRLQRADAEAGELSR